MDKEPSDEIFEEVYSQYLESIRESKLQAIESYDISENVNAFEIGGVVTWLNKATRVGLKNSLTIEKENDRTQTTLFLNNTPIVLDIDVAMHILDTVELYAIECYRQTELHKANVAAMGTVSEVENYDHTTGYPSHPVFEI